MSAYFVLFTACIMLLCTGCRSVTAPALPAPTGIVSAPPAPAASTPSAPTPAETRPAAASPADSAELSALLKAAMETCGQPPLLDLSGCTMDGSPELALKNLYYAVLSDSPELKYTYDLTAELLPGGHIRCTLLYMPYKLGLSEAGAPVSSLQDLIAVAREGLGGESVPIQITSPNLDVDDMSRVLQQVGSGYVNCTLNRDATAVDYAPAPGYIMEECLELLGEAESSAAELAAELITPDMDERTRLEALYGWLTENVLYDHRYYADRSSMSFLSTTATGAFQNALAICGGYSHALELLCRAAGFEVFTVSGQGAGEPHMWNLVCTDGTWRYYDATFDRGRRQYGYLYFGVDAETLAKNHQWDEALFQTLTL